MIQPGSRIPRPQYPPPQNVGSESVTEKESQSTSCRTPYVIARQPGLPSRMRPMNGMPVLSGTPPGLEYLARLDSVIVKQMLELLQFDDQWEGRNKYSLRNANGAQFLYAAEETDWYQRQFCGPSRGFTIHIVDSYSREVIRVERPFKCCSGTVVCMATCRCCASECTIESPPGNVLGTVVQRPTCCSSAFNVFDNREQLIFTIDRPCCCMWLCCTKDKVFSINTPDDIVVGTITKQWYGLVQEKYTDADTFVVQFPTNLDVRMKAVLLGATFLIDFMEFDSGPRIRTSAWKTF